MKNDNNKPAASDLSAASGSRQNAESACVDIYDDFDSHEVRLMPRSVQLAWAYGRKIKIENH